MKAKIIKKNPILHKTTTIKKKWKNEFWFILWFKTLEKKIYFVDHSIIGIFFGEDIHDIEFVFRSRRINIFLNAIRCYINIFFIIFFWSIFTLNFFPWNFWQIFFSFIPSFMSILMLLFFQSMNQRVVMIDFWTSIFELIIKIELCHFFL